MHTVGCSPRHISTHRDDVFCNLYDTSVLSSPLHGVIGSSLRSGPNFTPCNNGLLKAHVS